MNIKEKMFQIQIKEYLDSIIQTNGNVPDKIVDIAVDTVSYDLASCYETYLEAKDVNRHQVELIISELELLICPLDMYLKRYYNGDEKFQHPIDFIKAYESDNIDCDKEGIFYFDGNYVMFS